MVTRNFIAISLAIGKGTTGSVANHRNALKMAIDCSRNRPREISIDPPVGKNQKWQLLPGSFIDCRGVAFNRPRPILRQKLNPFRLFMVLYVVRGFSSTRHVGVKHFQNSPGELHLISDHCRQVDHPAGIPHLVVVPGQYFHHLIDNVGCGVIADNLMNTSNHYSPSIRQRDFAVTQNALQGFFRRFLEGIVDIRNIRALIFLLSPRSRQSIHWASGRESLIRSISRKDRAGPERRPWQHLSS